MALSHWHSEPQQPAGSIRPLTDLQMIACLLADLVLVQSRYWQSLRGLVRPPLASMDVLPQHIRTPQPELEEEEAGSSSGSEQGTPRVSAGGEHVQVGASPV